MTAAAVSGPWRLAPDNGRLAAAAAGLAVLATAAPMLLLGTALHVVLAAGALGAGALILFSPRRTLAVLVVVTAALPVHFLDAARLPLGLRPWEILLAAGILFALIDLAAFDRWRLRRTSADGLVAAFLLAALVSGAVGLWHGNEAVLRNLRYPMYYAVFFLVLHAARPGDGARLFAPLLVLGGVVVSAEYLLEFLGAVDPAAGERFVRVSRRQGIVLPAALLLLANGFLHDPRRWGRPLLLALFLFTGLGFAITLGRGMWAAFGLGLLVTVWLWHRSQPGAGRGARGRAWKAALLAAGVVAALVLSALAFQRLTGAALSAHAVERSRTFLDVSRDVQVVGRFLGYASAWEEILEHPFLGGGQGATFTAWSFDPEAGRFETWRAWTVDSLYLTLWLKMGIAGLLLFPWLCLHVGRRALGLCRSADPATRAFAAGSAATLAAMALLGLSDGSMMNGRFALLFGILFGLVMTAEPEAPCAA